MTWLCVVDLIVENFHSVPVFTNATCGFVYTYVVHELRFQVSCVQIWILSCISLYLANFASKLIGHWIFQVFNMKTTWCLKGGSEADKLYFLLKMKLSHIVHCALNLINKFKGYRCFDSFCLLSEDYWLP